LSLADLYESLKKPDLAIKVYERVPASSPLSRNAEIQLAGDLDALDRSDEAKKRLDHVIAEHPKDTEAILALGNIQRGRKEFAECAATYGKAIDTIATPDKSNWVVFYFRGICYERSHQWPGAEADMKKALELFPEQPLVLNYLGYSWVDQGVHLDDGMDMIRRAVEQRHDKRPILSDLRESGSIEQDADVVMFIFREEYYLSRAEPTRRPDEGDDKFNDRHDRWRERCEQTFGLAEVIIAKQRHGPIGTVKLHFEPETTKFDNFIGPETLPASNY